jgi:hypothetical protein
VRATEWISPDDVVARVAHAPDKVASEPTLEVEVLDTHQSYRVDLNRTGNLGGRVM